MSYSHNNSTLIYIDAPVINNYFEITNFDAPNNAYINFARSNRVNSKALI